MVPSKFLVASLLLAAALAGCSGDDGKSDVNSVSTSTQTNAGNTTLSGSISGGPGGVSGNGSVSDPKGNASANMTWSTESRSGTVSGNGAIFNVPFTEEEAFTVENGTAKLTLNLTVEGDDLTMSVRGPDCAASECAEEVKSASGKATLTVDKPPEGGWTVVLELEGTGPVEADYVLDISQFGPDGAA